MQTIQMDFSKKWKIFSEFFSSVFESAWNFQYFQKKDDPHSLGISEITVHETRA